MSKKDDFWDDIDDYLSNPYHDARQFEDYDEWMDEKEKIEDGYYREQFEESDDYIDDNIDEEIDNETEKSDSDYDDERTIGSITLSFSVEEPPRTLPMEGLWKYYNEGSDYWELGTALFDIFPELHNEFNPKWRKELSCDFVEIIGRVSEFDFKRALKYYDFLLTHFPFDEVFKMGEKHRHGTVNDLLLRTTYWLFECEEENIEKLYAYLKNNDKLFELQFIKYKWEGFEEFFMRDYLKFFAEKKDYAQIKKAYNTCLEHQKGSYTLMDLGDFWYSFISNYAWDIDEVMDDELYDFIKEAIKPLGVYGKKARKKLKEITPKSKYKESDED